VKRQPRGNCSGAALAVGAAAPTETGTRSVRPSRSRRFVKTCACDRGGFLRTRSPGRCSKTANRRRTSMGAATSGRFPDPAWCWHSFAGRKPSVGSSALPAGGHLVHGKLPGDSSSESHRRVDAARAPKPVRVACAPCPERTTDGRRSSRRAARALGRARLAREGRQASPSNRLRTAQGCRGPFTLYAGFALRRGLSATPRSPVGSRKNLSHTGSFPACVELADSIQVPDRCKTPERGLKTLGSLIPLVVIACGRLPVRRASRDHRVGSQTGSEAVDEAHRGVYAASLPQTRSVEARCSPRALDSSLDAASMPLQADRTPKTPPKWPPLRPCAGHLG
jgi:hypothetical protein